MASNLTDQVRGIVKVVTAVANGNLTPAPHGAGQGRGRGAGRHHQQHDRHARDLRRSGDQRGARSRRRGAARRPGERARRRRHLEGPHRQRQPARRQPHHAGARHRRSRHRGDQGRPDALDPGRDARRGRRAEGQHQHDDLEPARDHRAQPRAGLAEDQPRPVHRHAAGPARAEHRRPDAAQRAGPLVKAQQGTIYHLDGSRRRAASCKLLSSYAHERPAAGRDHRARRGPGRPVRGGEEAHPAHRRAGRLHHASPRASARRSRVSIVVLPVLFEGETKAVIELASLQPFSAGSPRLPRPAHAEHRRGASTPSKRRCAPRAC